MIIFTKKFDVHSVIHFLGCYAMVPTFMDTFNFDLTAASGWAFALGILWEVLDALNYEWAWDCSFLDPRGADITDLIVDFCGVLLAFWVFY